MRLTIPSIMQGTLGSLVQKALGGVNALLVSNQGDAYATSFSSSATTNPLNPFAAGSNTAGARIVYALANQSNPPSNIGIHSWLAKATAPANFLDGDVIATCKSMGYDATNSIYLSFIEAPSGILIPSGLGLYLFSGNVIGQRTAAARYTLF